MSSKITHISLVQPPRRIPADVAARAVDSALERVRDHLDSRSRSRWVMFGIFGICMTAAILTAMNFLMHH